MTISANTIVRVSFRTDRMTNSTELKRLRRSLDTLYYALLFTESDTYQGRNDVWQTWARMGFATGVQEAPPGAERTDRLRLETFSDGKTLTFTVHPGNEVVVNGLVEVLREVELVRSDLASMSSDERAATLVANDVVNKRLVTPVLEATAELAQDDVAALQGALRTAMAALTYPVVLECTVAEEALEG
jgi:hypothetical protein